MGTEIYVYVNKNSGMSIMKIHQSSLWFVTLLGLASCVGIWMIRPKNY